MSVIIRERPLKSGQRALYIDVNPNGSRNKIKLDLRLTGNKLLDKEALLLAKVIRSQIELELVSGAYGFRSRVLKQRN